MTTGNTVTGSQTNKLPEVSPAERLFNDESGPRTNGPAGPPAQLLTFAGEDADALHFKQPQANGNASAAEVGDFQGLPNGAAAAASNSSSFESNMNQEMSKGWPSWNDSSGGGGGGGGGGAGGSADNAVPTSESHPPIVPMAPNGRGDLNSADMVLMMLKQQHHLNGLMNGFSGSPSNYNRMRLVCADNACHLPGSYPPSALRHPFDFSNVSASLAEILQSNDFQNAPSQYPRRVNGTLPVRCSPLYRPLSAYCADMPPDLMGDTINPVAASLNQLSDNSSLPHPDGMGFVQNRRSPLPFREERYSRKVFVGGLPPDIDEEEIIGHFDRFGPLIVDWPHKAESKSYFPPKGYAFLIYSDERSVQTLIEACVLEDQKLYMCVSSPSIKDKPVQIRPWLLSDSDYVMDGTQPLDPRKTIFVGGVPRPLRAVELALIMNRLYGGVCYAGIDTDPELKYPKGAGRVAFSSQQSYIAAISARFVQLRHSDIDKRVEVKPYVLDDQMCDECQGARCNGKYAPFFCANVTCLQYYCEHCWTAIHSRAGREFHKPLVKEGADRPRSIPYRWS